MSDITITAGKRRKLITIPRPDDTEILADAELATANGIALVGQGPYRCVSGVKVRVVVGPNGCTCVLARNGVWCLHRSLYAVATGTVLIKPAPSPISLKPHRERRGWTRRPLWIVRPVTPIRPRTVA